jgi:hypothetical protein
LGFVESTERLAIARGKKMKSKQRRPFGIAGQGLMMGKGNTFGESLGIHETSATHL